MSDDVSHRSQRLVLHLDPEVADKLRDIARQQNRSVASVARSVLANGLFILETTGDGNKVVIEDRRGTQRPLTPA